MLSVIGDVALSLQLSQQLVVLCGMGFVILSCTDLQLNKEPQHVKQVAGSTPLHTWKV